MSGKLVVTLLLFSIVGVCQGGLVGTVVQGLNTTIEQVDSGDKTFNKTVLNEKVPVIVRFTMQPWSQEQDDQSALVWKLNENDTLDFSKKELHLVKSHEGEQWFYTLNITQNQLNYAGVISLEVKPQSGESFTASATLNSQPIITQFSKAKRLLQGDRLSVQCVVRGYPLPQRVEWSREVDKAASGAEGHNGSQVFVDGKRIKTEKTQLADDTLRIDPLEFEDDGYLRCSARNDLGADYVIVELRVKDRLAALWPFIGIVIEVLLLVTAILLYEKRRSKHYNAARDEAKEGLNGAYGQQGSGAAAAEGGDHDSDTRQRAVKA